MTTLTLIAALGIASASSAPQTERAPLVYTAKEHKSAKAKNEWNRLNLEPQGVNPFSEVSTAKCLQVTSTKAVCR